MTMMFEVQDLAVASPATVSRCGMVYLEPSILGLQPFVNCYLKTLPDAIFDHKDKLQSLFDRFLEVIIVRPLWWHAIGGVKIVATSKQAIEQTNGQ